MNLRPEFIKNKNEIVKGKMKKRQEKLGWEGCVD